VRGLFGFFRPRGPVKTIKEGNEEEEEDGRKRGSDSSYTSSSSGEDDGQELSDSDASDGYSTPDEVGDQVPPNERLVAAHMPVPSKALMSFKDVFGDGLLEDGIFEQVEFLSVEGPLMPPGELRAEKEYLKSLQRRLESALLVDAMPLDKGWNVDPRHRHASCRGLPTKGRLADGHGLAPLVAESIADARYALAMLEEMEARGGGGLNLIAEEAESVWGESEAGEPLEVGALLDLDGPVPQAPLSRASSCAASSGAGGSRAASRAGSAAAQLRRARSGASAGSGWSRAGSRASRKASPEELADEQYHGDREDEEGEGAGALRAAALVGEGGGAGGDAVAGAAAEERGAVDDEAVEAGETGAVEAPCAVEPAPATAGAVEGKGKGKVKGKAAKSAPGAGAGGKKAAGKRAAGKKKKGAPAPKSGDAEGAAGGEAGDPGDLEGSEREGAEVSDVAEEGEAEAADWAVEAADVAVEAADVASGTEGTPLDAAAGWAVTAPAASALLPAAPRAVTASPPIFPAGEASASAPSPIDARPASASPAPPGAAPAHVRRAQPSPPRDAPAAEPDAALGARRGSFPSASSDERSGASRLGTAGDPQERPWSVGVSSALDPGSLQVLRVPEEEEEEEEEAPAESAALDEAPRGAPRAPPSPVLSGPDESTSSTSTSLLSSNTAASSALLSSCRTSRPPSSRPSRPGSSRLAQPSRAASALRRASAPEAPAAPAPPRFSATSGSSSSPSSADEESTEGGEASAAASPVDGAGAEAAVAPQSAFGGVGGFERLGTPERSMRTERADEAQRAQRAQKGEEEEGLGGSARPPTAAEQPPDPPAPARPGTPRAASPAAARAAGGLLAALSSVARSARMLVPQRPAGSPGGLGPASEHPTLPPGSGRGSGLLFGLLGRRAEARPDTGASGGSQAASELRDQVAPVMQSFRRLSAAAPDAAGLGGGAAPLLGRASFWRPSASGLMLPESESADDPRPGVSFRRLPAVVAHEGGGGFEVSAEDARDEEGAPIPPSQLLLPAIQRRGSMPRPLRRELSAGSTFVRRLSSFGRSATGGRLLGGETPDAETSRLSSGVVTRMASAGPSAGSAAKTVRKIKGLMAKGAFGGQQKQQHLRMGARPASVVIGERVLEQGDLAAPAPELRAASHEGSAAAPPRRPPEEPARQHASPAAAARWGLVRRNIPPPRAVERAPEDHLHGGAGPPPPARRAPGSPAALARWQLVRDNVERIQADIADRLEASATPA